MRFILFFALLLFLHDAHAEEARWEYGAGLGFVRFEHYPAANQWSNWVLPVGTFEYRGEIVRADDRNGAKAYLWREGRFSVDISGGLLPALNSNDNEARRGMNNLPWTVELGPELIVELDHGYELRGRIFQATTTDFNITKFSGQVVKLDAFWKWYDDLEPDKSWNGRIQFQLTAASADFMATYFDVRSDQVTVTRPQYESRAGLLEDQISILQIYRSGFLRIYAGGAVDNYDVSSNRTSPLHKSDHNFSAFAGLTYTLGQSKKTSVPDEDTRGLLNRK